MPRPPPRPLLPPPRPPPPPPPPRLRFDCPRRRLPRASSGCYAYDCAVRRCCHSVTGWAVNRRNLVCCSGVASNQNHRFVQRHTPVGATLHTFILMVGQNRSSIVLADNGGHWEPQKTTKPINCANALSNVEANDAQLIQKQLQIIKRKQGKCRQQSAIIAAAISINM